MARIFGRAATVSSYDEDEEVDDHREDRQSHRDLQLLAQALTSRCSTLAPPPGQPETRCPPDAEAPGPTITAPAGAVELPW